MCVCVCDCNTFCELARLQLLSWKLLMYDPQCGWCKAEFYLCNFFEAVIGESSHQTRLCRCVPLFVHAVSVWYLCFLCMTLWHSRLTELSLAAWRVCQSRLAMWRATVVCQCILRGFNCFVIFYHGTFYLYLFFNKTVTCSPYLHNRCLGCLKALQTLQKFGNFVSLKASVTEVKSLSESMLYIFYSPG